MDESRERYWHDAFVGTFSIRTITRGHMYDDYGLCFRQELRRWQLWGIKSLRLQLFIAIVFRAHLLLAKRIRLAIRPDHARFGIAIVRVVPCRKIVSELVHLANLVQQLRGRRPIGECLGATHGSRVAIDKYQHHRLLAAKLTQPHPLAVNRQLCLFGSRSFSLGSMRRRSSSKSRPPSMPKESAAYRRTMASVSCSTTRAARTVRDTFKGSTSSACR